MWMETRPATILYSFVIWGALLLGQLAFMGIAAVILSQNKQPPPAPQMVLLYLGVAMLAVVVTGAFFIRAFIFKRGLTEKDGVGPGAFVTGNIIFWAACEAVTFFALVGVLVNRSFWPTMTVAAVSMACQIAAFPRKSTLEGLNSGG
jgi:hypothetical protein